MSGYKLRKGPPECGYCDCGSHAWAGVRNGYVTLVDAEDGHLLERDRWRRSATGYAVRNDAAKAPRRLLHREVVQARPDRVVDHKNHDKLDNRRSNLRECTVSENAANRKSLDPKNKSGFRGVHAFQGKWRAKISINNKTKNLGVANSPEAAARLYDGAAVRHFGEFAKVNFPEEIVW